MKRILFISRTLDERFGGMQTQARSLLSALQNRSDIVTDCVGYHGRRWGLPLFFLRALMTAVFTGADVVHVGDAVLSPILPFIALVRPRLRRTATVHGLDISWHRPLYQYVIRHCLRCAHRIAAVSEATKTACITLGVSADRIVIIPCGIPMPHRTGRSVQKRPTLLTLGRLVPRKGVVWFLEDVFPLLLSRHSDLRYIIAGNGPELSSIRRVVAGRGLQRSIDVLGPVPERHKEALLSEASLLLMPNVPVFGDMEGFGITAIEAAARGLPVVAADLEGLRDSVIDGVTGLRFQPLDLQSAAIAVESALLRSWDSDSMERAIRERFAADVIASRYVHELF